jgi:hypothetical protein
MIDPPGHPIDLGGKIGGRLRGGKLDGCRRAHAGRIGDRPLDLGLEALVEGLPFLVQHDTQTQARQVHMHPLPDQRGRVIADQTCRLVDPARGILAHPFASVQHTVHRGGGQPRLAGDILDGWAVGHGLS